MNLWCAKNDVNVPICAAGNAEAWDDRFGAAAAGVYQWLEGDRSKFAVRPVADGYGRRLPATSSL